MENRHGSVARLNAKTNTSGEQDSPALPKGQRRCCLFANRQSVGICTEGSLKIGSALASKNYGGYIKMRRGICGKACASYEVIKTAFK